jgi:hypothetical protein
MPMEMKGLHTDLTLDAFGILRMVAVCNSSTALEEEEQKRALRNNQTRA